MTRLDSVVKNSHRNNIVSMHVVFIGFHFLGLTYRQNIEH